MVFINRFFNFFRKKKYIYWAIALVFIVGGIFIFNSKKTTSQTIVISHTNFVNQISISGKVESAEEANLGFAASGRVDKILIENNKKVKEGQILAQLEIVDLISDLKIKEINSKTSNISLEDARQNLEKITLQENTKVENAYRTFLTSDLELIPNSVDYTVTPPFISGIYDGIEGTYKINIKKENVTINDFTLRTFNLEKTERLINKEGPTLLGTRGLYISFEDDIEKYNETTWYLNIPNKSGASYLVNYNAYNEAKNERDLAIKNAEFEYQKLLTEDNDGISSIAQAEIDKIRAEIKKNTIYAPFDGIITNIEKEVGETASLNENVITIMGSDIFQIESYVPEVNIAQINLNDEATITLDAYGESVSFNAKVVSIDSAETVRDGVSTYRVRFQFKEKDDRIKSGMTANVAVMIFNKPNVIVVPGGVIFEKVTLTSSGQAGKKFVQVKSNEKIEDREVTTGEVSSLGQVEVISGLSDGDIVILNPVIE